LPAEHCRRGPVDVPEPFFSETDHMPIDPQEDPPIKPGRPTEPPQESPPGNPRPEIPPPVRDPGEPARPEELPGKMPDELPVRGPQGPALGPMALTPQREGNMPQGTT
jgi:hypothetical protein